MQSDTESRRKFLIGGFARTNALLLALVLVLATLLVFSRSERLKQAEKIAEYEKREVAERIDKQLAGLRIPYEAILYDYQHYRSVYEDRAKQCKEQGIETISHFSSVLRDESYEIPVFSKRDDPDSEARAGSVCGNAAFELYHLNAYVNEACMSLLWARDQKDDPLGKALRDRDEHLMKMIHVHVGRALKSKNPDIALASCKVWLAFFETNADVTARLTELTGGQNRCTYRGEGQESYEDYTSETIEAAKLIDQYSLAVHYPDDLKTGRAFRESFKK